MERPALPPSYASRRAWQRWEDALSHWVDYERWEEDITEPNLASDLPAQAGDKEAVFFDSDWIGVRKDGEGTE